MGHYRVFKANTLRDYLTIATLAAVLVGVFITAQITRADDGAPPDPTAADLQVYNTAFSLTSYIAVQLDQLSNAANVQEEDKILGRIRPLLHPDVSVTTDGRTFTGREVVIEGMRIAHSRVEDEAKRLEATPHILASSPTQFTLGTVQQQWWKVPATGQLLMSNRDTKLTIERLNDKWVVKNMVLQTVTGPIAQ